MTSCDNCGGHISVQYRRVMSDNHGRVHECPACGAGAGSTGGADQIIPGHYLGR